MRLPHIAVTGLLLLGSFPVAVAIGIFDAAFFGGDHGANTTRFMLGLMVGLIVGVRHLSKEPPRSPTQ